MTAITLGIKSTLGILGKFVSNVARVAFGGLLKGSLNGFDYYLLVLSRN